MGILDIGLARTTTGAKIFGAMKGAVDGGIAIPHKPNLFLCMGKEKGDLNAKVHRDRIFGVHVAKYMKEIEEIKKSNPDEKIVQFSAFAKNKIAAGDVEAMYKKAHAEIRAKSKAYNIKRLTRKERQDAAAKKVAALR